MRRPSRPALRRTIGMTLIGGMIVAAGLPASPTAAELTVWVQAFSFLGYLMAAAACLRAARNTRSGRKLLLAFILAAATVAVLPSAAFATFVVLPVVAACAAVLRPR